MDPLLQDPSGECAQLSEDAPPSRSTFRERHWPTVSEERWQDWRWQQQNAIRTTSELARFLPLDAHARERLTALESRFKLAIPPYYLNLATPDDPHDPILLQAAPSPEEDADGSLEDPLDEDKDSPVNGVTHRYPDRVLMLTTPVCSMYCRFCTRKRVTMMNDGWDGPSRDEQRMIEYVREHEEIHDVILSGGDPLMLKPEKLRWFLRELDAIEHVGMVRIGTRVPVTLPQRLFDPELIAILANAPKLWIQTHFNHPAELSSEAARACNALLRAGLPLNNHAVLLKGVNDSVDTMRRLMRGLLRMKVRPYYIFHCDPVVGAAHFRTSVWKGLEIMEGLRGHVSGLGVPTYVVDGMHGAGKIPMMPNYLLSASDRMLVLRNYEGLMFGYSPEGDVLQTPAARGADDNGVSGLLSGARDVLVPQRVRRLERRIENAAAQSVPATVNGNGSPSPDAAPRNGAHFAL